MKNIFRNLFVTIFALLLASATLFAQVSETREVKKGFKVSKGTVIDIGNKYGDIEVDTWDKDSVRVEIFVRVSEKSRDKLKKKMNEISFELSQSGHYLVINTRIGDKSNIIFSEFNKIKESIGVGDTQVEINMKVKIPDNLEVKIMNKFGNIYINDYKGDMTIDLANGKLKAHDLPGYINLKLSFGDAVINTIGSGALEIYYSDFNLSSAKKLRVTSKTSDISITEIEDLLANSSRDTYKIRLISDFETESSWTDFSISEFNRKSDIRMNYGDLNIETIKNTFSNIFIDSKSSKINLCFDKRTDVNFDIITNQDINLPMDAKIDKKEQIDPKEKIIRYLGRTGDVKVENPKLVLKSTSGEITIIKK